MIEAKRNDVREAELKVDEKNIGARQVLQLWIADVRKSPGSAAEQQYHRKYIAPFKADRMCVRLHRFFMKDKGQPLFSAKGR